MLPCLVMGKIVSTDQLCFKVALYHLCHRSLSFSSDARASASQSSEVRHKDSIRLRSTKEATDLRI